MIGYGAAILLSIAMWAALIWGGLHVARAVALPQDTGGCYWERVQVCPPLSGICHYSEVYRCP